MFTGIVEAVGKVQAIAVNGQGARVTIASQGLDMADVKLGDSIATNGVCLTVVDYSQNSFSADVSTETLKRTGFAYYQIGQSVNLEKAMLPSTRFGGHIVSGHVDAVVEITRIERQGNSWDFHLTMPTEVAPYLAEKGSVTIDGTSLTVNSVADSSFRLTIVPHTTEQTIISQYQVGTKVNLEVDVIARYLERLLLARTGGTEPTTASAGVTESLLQKAGFIK